MTPKQAKLLLSDSEAEDWPSLIIDDKKGMGRLHVVAWLGRTEMVEMLLEKGADIEARDERYNTPLHLAALQGRMEMVQLLLEKGADHTAGDGRGETALVIARGAGQTELANFLQTR